MLTCNRLCIDPGDGSPALDYRIADDSAVEERVSSQKEQASANAQFWHRLTPDQLRVHVLSDTVVARWLIRRMGLHGLLRACNEDLQSPNHDSDSQFSTSEPHTGERWPEKAA